MSDAIVVYPGEAERHSWARWMVGRTMSSNKNNLISVVGKTGSGKTLSAISICEIMSEMDGVEFTVDHIVFDLMELMELINSGKLRRGSKIILDEPQVSISAKDFQSQANKVFNFLLTTFRHLNLSLFFCTPFETLLDKSTRKLFHARFETMSINKKSQTCRLKPRYIEYSDFKSEPYRKRLFLVYREKGITKHNKLFHWDVERPSKPLEKAYELKKKAFTSRLNVNIMDRLKKFEASGKSITAKPEEEKELEEGSFDKELHDYVRINGYQDQKQLSAELVKAHGWRFNVNRLNKAAQRLRKSGNALEIFKIKKNEI